MERFDVTAPFHFGTFDALSVDVSVRVDGNVAILDYEVIIRT